MNLLTKLENAVNFLLIKLGQYLIGLIPQRVKQFWLRIEGWIQYLRVNFKLLPGMAKEHGMKAVQNGKATVLTYDYKSKFQETLKKAEARRSKSSGAMKNLLMTPFYLMAEWLQGLSAGQSLLLLTFTAGSVLSVIGVVSSGQRIVDNHMSSRAPASVEEATDYNRPAYYKKQHRHFEVTALRLPVYVPEVNEIKSVDIDFTATMTNRNARVFLEKHEFQLRDHLILQIEPMVASFPLVEEGKQIIREKLLMEINDYLIENKVEGNVIDLKLTYILAN